MGNFGTKVADEDEEKRKAAALRQARRKRNSLAEMIVKFIQYEDDDFHPLIQEYLFQQEAEGHKKQNYLKGSRYTNASKYILHGNMRELKRQVIMNFENINRKYKEYDGCTLVHICCQEGYPDMLTYVLEWDEMDTKDLDLKIDVNIKNDKDRTPILLCFTPPVMTYLGQMYGVDNQGRVRYKLPAGFTEKDHKDFLKPGGPASRQQCVDIVITHGAEVNVKDYQDHTPLHYAAIWGWVHATGSLLDAKADVNAVTLTGITPLMLAVQFGHIDIVDLLLAEEGIQVNEQDNQGRTALYIAVESEDIGVKSKQQQQNSKNNDNHSIHEQNDSKNGDNNNNNNNNNENANRSGSVSTLSSAAGALFSSSKKSSKSNNNSHNKKKNKGNKRDGKKSKNVLDGKGVSDEEENDLDSIFSGIHKSKNDNDDDSDSDDSNVIDTTQYDIVERLLVAGANPNISATIIISNNDDNNNANGNNGVENSNNNKTDVINNSNNKASAVNNLSPSKIASTLQNNNNNNINRNNDKAADSNDDSSVHKLAETAHNDDNNSLSSINTLSTLNTKDSLSKYIGHNISSRNGSSVVQNNKGIVLNAVGGADDYDSDNDEEGERKYVLDVACDKQLSEVIHLLLDWHVAHDITALLARLQDEWAESVRERVLKEEGENRQALQLASKLAEVEHRLQASADESDRWVEYRDKRERTPFYYNIASRRSQREIPVGFKPDRTIAVKEVIFGLHFYH